MIMKVACLFRQIAFLLLEFQRLLRQHTVLIYAQLMLGYRQF